MSTENLTCNVINMSGETVGTVALKSEVFGAPIMEDLVHAVVTWQRNARRAGTHATLNRAKIQASNKKPYKQKGTGQARVGSSVSPIRVGGAVTFGPQPRSYETRVSKRARKQALTSALTDKFANGKLIVIDSIKVADGKTKSFAASLEKIGLTDKKSLILFGADTDATTVRAARNINTLKPLAAEGINVYDLVNYNYVVCSRESLEAIQNKILESGVSIN